MTLCEATIAWRRDAGAAFTDNRYSRAHVWRFDGGAEVPASSSPHIVPLPMSDPAGVDPEEAFVASLASCHLLWFLSLAAEQGWRVEAYEDAARGVLGRNAQGKLAMTLVTLRPRVVFGGESPPAREAVDALHHRAHEACFIASSVLSEVRCEPIHG
jgi:organic hydroperoxide reductase OsmC/OhrA